jgi:hypothetical protein
LASKLDKATSEREIREYFEPLGKDHLEAALNSVELLSIDVSEQQPKSLLETPLVRLADGNFICPIPEFLSNAISPVGLYVRGLRRFPKGRDFSDQVGQRVASYVSMRLSRLVAKGWELTDIDRCVISEAAVGKHADFLLVTPSRDLAVVLEVKASLQSRNARLGDTTELKRCSSLYRKAFQQIEATVEHFGSASPLNLSNVSKSMETFGLAVTMEKHFITRCGEEVFPGLAIGKPSWSGVSSKTPSTIICLDELDYLIDCLDQIDEDQLRQIMVASTSGPDPGRNMFQVLSESCPKVKSSVNEAGVKLMRDFEDSVRNSGPPGA